jgi:hypothetical protein
VTSSPSRHRRGSRPARTRRAGRQADRQAVELRLGRILDHVDAQRLAHARVEGTHFLSSNALPSDSIGHAMPHLANSGSGAPPTRWVGNRAAEFRVRLLQLDQLAEQLSYSASLICGASWTW